MDSPWSLDASGTLSLKAVNKVGKDININAVYVNGASKTISSPATPINVTSGATSAWITVASGSAGTGGGSYKLDSVAIEYYVGTDTSKRFNSTGTLSGTRQ